MHALNNAALLAFALARSDGDFTAAITTCVSRRLGHRLDGATAGSIAGALAGATALPDGVDRPAAQPPRHDDRRLRRHRLRRARPPHRGRTARRAGDLRRASTPSSPVRSTGRPCCRSTASPIPRSSTGEDPRRPGRSRRLAALARPARALADGSARQRHGAATLTATRHGVGEPLLQRGDRVALGRATLRPRRQVFTPDRWLQAAADHGGFDAIVLWHAYPIIGLDERNQFDFYRDVSGLAELIAAAARQRRARVPRLQPVGRRHAAPRGERRARCSTALVTDLGADGVFLDTIREGGRDLVGRPAPPPPAAGARRRIARPARTHRRPRAELGAVVRRQPGAGRARRPLVRAPSPAAPHAPVEPRPQRRAAVELDERYGDRRLGRGVRLVGRAGTTATGRRCDACSACQQHARRRASRGRRGRRSSTRRPTAIAAGVYTSRFSDGTTTVWTAVNRGHDAFAGPLLDVTAPFDACFDLTTGSRLDDPAAAVEVPARGIGGSAGGHR